MNIGVIGTGKLGLAFALHFEKNGFNVFGSSDDKDYVEKLNNKNIVSVEPGIVDGLFAAKNISFTTNNHSVISNCDFIYVMVATPSLPSGDYDMSAVWKVVNDLITYPGDVVNKTLVIGSTTNPKNCDKIQEVLLDKKINLVYCPTFSAQGSVMKNVADPHMLLLGSDNEQALDLCKNVFCKIVSNDTPVYKMSRTAAELVKISGNCRDTMMISFTNMIGQIFIKSGLEKDLETATTALNFVKIPKRYKFGFGFGGPCFPRDNRSLFHYAKNTLAIDYKLGDLIDNLNSDHMNFLVDYFLSKNINRLPFYFDYVSYKKGVNQFEESHQLKVCKKLLSAGFQVYINPSEFLLQKIIDDLSTEFTDLVKFVSIEDLTNQNIEVLTVNE